MKKSQWEMLLVLVVEQDIKGFVWNAKSATKFGWFWSKRVGWCFKTWTSRCVSDLQHFSRVIMTWGKGIWSSFIIWLWSDIPKREPRLWCWVDALGWKKERLLSFCDSNVCGFVAVLFSIWAKRKTRCQISFRMRNVMSLERDFSAKQIENNTNIG